MQESFGARRIMAVWCVSGGWSQQCVKRKKSKTGGGSSNGEVWWLQNRSARQHSFDKRSSWGGRC